MTEFALLPLPRWTRLDGPGSVRGARGFASRHGVLLERLRSVRPEALEGACEAGGGALNGGSPVCTWRRCSHPSDWEKPPTEGGKMAFRRTRREALAARLENMVQLLTERGSVSVGQPTALLKQVLAAPANLWGYAHALNERVPLVPRQNCSSAPTAHRWR